MTRLGLVLLAVCGACATAGRPDREPPGPGPGPTSPDAALSACAFSGMLATWSFASEPGSQTTTAATATATGVTAGGVARAAGLTAVSGASSINASNWAMSTQLDPSKYYSLTLAAPAGCSLGVSSVAIDARSSGTGPKMAAIATSADQFAATSAVSTTAPDSVALAMGAVTGTLELRIYGFGATGAAGTMRVEGSLILTGTIQ